MAPGPERDVKSKRQKAKPPENPHEGPVLFSLRHGEHHLMSSGLHTPGDHQRSGPLSFPPPANQTLAEAASSALFRQGRNTSERPEMI